MSATVSTTGRSTRARHEVLALVIGKVVANASLVAVAVLSARALGAHARGVIVIVTTLTVLTSLLGSLGVHTAFRVGFLGHQDAMSPAAYLGLAPILLAAQLLVCTSAAALVLPHAGYEPTRGHFFLVGTLGTAMLAAVLAYELLLAIGRPTALAIVEGAGSLLPLGIFIAADAAGFPSTRLVIAGLAAGYAASAVAAVLVALRDVGASATVDAWRWRRMVVEGRAPLGHAMAQFSLNRADRLVIAFAGTSRDVGLYSVAAACSELVRLVPMATGQVVLHRVATGLVSIRRAAHVGVALTAAAAVALALIAGAAPTIVGTVFGDDYREAADVIRIIAIAEIAMTVYLIASHILLGAGRAKEAALAAVTGAAIVLALDLVLVPRYGITGAAWASLVGYWAMAVVATRWVILAGRSSEHPTQH